MPEADTEFEYLILPVREIQSENTRVWLDSVIGICLFAAAELALVVFFGMYPNTCFTCVITYSIPEYLLFIQPKKKQNS